MKCAKTETNTVRYNPFALSLSKGERLRSCFEELSMNPVTTSDFKTKTAFA